MRTANRPRRSGDQIRSRRHGAAFARRTAMTPKKILVPSDFSPSSKLAFEYALMLASAFHSTVHVFNAWEVPAYLRPDLTVWSGDVSTTLSAHARAEAEKAMREFLADSKADDLPNVTSQIVN